MKNKIKCIVIILCIITTTVSIIKTPHKPTFETIAKIRNFSYLHSTKTNEMYLKQEHVLYKSYDLKPHSSHKPTYYYDDSIIPLSTIRYISRITDKPEEYKYDEFIIDINDPQKHLIELYKLNQPKYENMLDIPIPNIIK